MGDIAIVLSLGLLAGLEALDDHRAVVAVDGHHAMVTAADLDNILAARFAPTTARLVSLTSLLSDLLSHLDSPMRTPSLRSRKRIVRAMLWPAPLQSAF